MTEHDRSEPDWAGHAIWWQVYPLGFADAEPRGREVPGGGPVVHRLAGLIDWLDYAVELGASGLALGPVFAAHTHGYDTVDHRRIDPRLGDGEDFDRLIAAAHQRGLRVLLDGVFNHVGRAFEPLVRALEQGPGSPTAGWFQLHWDAEGRPEWGTFEGHGDLVALDHSHPDVAGYVTDVMCHWLGRGADGWRLDAAYAVPRPFWAAVLAEVRRRHPEAYLLGEVIHGDYAEFVVETGMHAVTQYELWKAIWSSLNDGNLFELAHALKRHNTWLETFVPLTFLGNHDVSRIAGALTDERHLPHALALLATLGGTPSVYYGDEQAFRGVKEERVGGDDEIRPAFPAEGPSGLAPWGWPTYRLHQRLFGLRRRHPWLHRARAETVHLTNTQLALLLHDQQRQHGEQGQRLVTVLNLDDAPAEIPVSVPVTAVLAGEAELPAGEVARLPGHGWAVLEVSAA